MSVPDQWKQYLLDNCASVREAIEIQSRIRIFPSSGRYPTHFFVADKSGQCAAIEFIKGKMFCYTGADMPVKILTNSTYAKSVGYLQQHKGFGESHSVPNSRSSLDRFVRAADLVRSYSPLSSGPAVDYGFKILEEVAQGEYTAWRIIYDVKQMCVYFMTLSNPEIRYIDIKAFDLSCGSPPQVFELDSVAGGDVTRSFKKYSTKINQTKLILEKEDMK